MLYPPLCPPLYAALRHRSPPPPPGSVKDNTRQRFPSPNVVNAPMNQAPPRSPVTCEIDGKLHKGTYWIAGKILTVTTGKRQEQTSRLDAG